MTLILNTLPDNNIACELQTVLTSKGVDSEVVNTTNMNISHCIGCNHCFLKTPGICSIKDDYIHVLKKLAHSSNLWLISDTRFGFIDYKGKRVMDRILPLLTMYLSINEGLMRHVPRYGNLNVGVIYKGNGNQDLLEDWSQRTACNLFGHSLGVFHAERIKEVLSCI